MNADKSPRTQESRQPSENKPGDTGERTLSLLQKIQAGTVDPKCIRPVERRQIVSYLMADGYCTADMAQILKVSDRSIERDKKAIRETNALAADPEMVEQMTGRLVCEANLSIQRIRKAARDKNTPSVVKVDAEHRCYQIVSDMIGSLQRLGYLPIATARLQTNITHNIGQIPDYSQMQAEVQRLKQIAGETKGTDSQLIEQFNAIEGQLETIKLIDKIDNVSNVIESKGVQNEQDE